jgi:hypothetical protein
MTPPEIGIDEEGCLVSILARANSLIVAGAGALFY